jgi:hypothetical protein
MATPSSRPLPVENKRPPISTSGNTRARPPGLRAKPEDNCAVTTRIAPAGPSTSGTRTPPKSAEAHTSERTPHGSGAADSRDLFRPVSENERQRGRAVASVPASGLRRGQRRRDGGVHQAGDASIREEASAASCAAATLALDDEEERATRLLLPTRAGVCAPGSRPGSDHAVVRRGHAFLPASRATTHVVGKPFSYPELRARVEALLRRADVRRRPGRLRVGALEVDAAARVVRLHGAPVELSQKEFALVRTLASDPTRVFTKDELLRTIWDFRTLGSNRRIARYRLGANRRMPQQLSSLLTRVEKERQRVAAALPRMQRDGSRSRAVDARNSSGGSIRRANWATFALHDDSRVRRWWRRMTAALSGCVETRCAGGAAVFRRRRNGWRRTCDQRERGWRG